jgi:hypothetical protein
MSEEKKPTRIKVAGLWKNQKDGREYLSGNWGDVRILIFPNGYKERDNQPDSYMYLAPRPPPANPQAGRDEVNG